MFAAKPPDPALSFITPLTAVSSSVSSSVVACRECTSDNNAGLIDNMMRRGVLHSQVVAAAMKRVDRRHYVTPAPPASRQLHPSSAYVDSPQYIGTSGLPASLCNRWSQFAHSLNVNCSLCRLWCYYLRASHARHVC